MRCAIRPRHAATSRRTRARLAAAPRSRPSLNISTRMRGGSTHNYTASSTRSDNDRKRSRRNPPGGARPLQNRASAGRCFPVGRLSILKCARCTGGRKAERQMSSPRQKPEDSAHGCRANATLDRERAAAASNERMRASLERSAEVWTTRAKLLDRLEASFHARSAANVSGPRSPSRLESDHG